MRKGRRPYPMNPAIPPNTTFLEPGVPWTPEGSRLSPAGRLLQPYLINFLSFLPSVMHGDANDECGAAWR